MTTRWKDKDPADVINVEFDFSADATAVTAPSVTITLAAGTDPDPSLMLVGAPTVSGAIVYQRIQGGVEGASYALQCLAYNGADRYSIEAILPVRARPTLSTAVPIYLPESAFEQRFGQPELTDLLASGASYADIENDAAHLINGYLAARYVLPLSTVPLLVRNLAADITRFKLWRDRAPEEIRQRYDDALARLKMLSQGLISLPPGSDGSKPSPGVTFAGYCAERVFTGSTMRGY